MGAASSSRASGVHVPLAGAPAVATPAGSSTVVAAGAVAAGASASFFPHALSANTAKKRPVDARRRVRMFPPWMLHPRDTSADLFAIVAGNHIRRLRQLYMTKAPTKPAG